MSQSNTLACDECGTKGELGRGYGAQHAVECPNCGDTWTVEGVPKSSPMGLNRGDLNDAAKEEAYRALEEVVEDGFEDFDVTEIESHGRSLTVQLDSLEHRRQIRVTIDDNP